MSISEDRAKANEEKAVKIKAHIELLSDMKFGIKKLEKETAKFNSLKDLRTLITHDQATENQ